MATPRITELADIIASQTDLISKYLRLNDLPEPSFSVGAPTDAFESSTPDVQKAKTSVLEAIIELRQLLEGPVKLLLPEVVFTRHDQQRQLLTMCAQSNFAPLAAIHHFNIASHVPKEGSISFYDLADKCGILEHDLRRVIRYTAIHHRVFCEPKDGFVAHTAASKILADNEKIQNLMGLTFAECWPAHSRVSRAPRSSE